MFSYRSTGIDSEGHAANFVETEQIVLYDGAMASFVQASLTPGGPKCSRYLLALI